MKRVIVVVVSALELAGCSYPSNFVNDVQHMGDPVYDECRRNADALSDYGSQCAHEADPTVKAAKAEQARQAAEQQRQMAASQRQRILAQQNTELAKGYTPSTVQDFLLDKKDLASRNAKISITGIYMPIGDIDVLFQSPNDAYQFSQGRNFGVPRINLLIDNASRDLRSQVIACRSDQGSAYFGCKAHLIGTVTICVLSDPLGNKQEVPCLSVDDGSIDQP